MIALISDFSEEKRSDSSKNRVLFCAIKKRVLAGVGSVRYSDLAQTFLRSLATRDFPAPLVKAVRQRYGREAKLPSHTCVIAAHSASTRPWLRSVNTAWSSR